MMDWFKLWVLGQRFLIPRLQNDALKTIPLCAQLIYESASDDELLELYNLRKLCHYAYDNSSKDSPLRKLSSTLMLSMLEVERRLPANFADNDANVPNVDFIDGLPNEMAEDILKLIIKGSFSVEGAFKLALGSLEEFLIPVEE